MRAIRTATCLNNTIWRNKYLAIKARVKIYKDTIGPIMIFTTKTQTDAVKIGVWMLDMGKMKLMRGIDGINLITKMITGEYGVDGINK